MNIAQKLTPLISRVKMRMRGNVGLHSAASRSWTISPAVEFTSPPAIFTASDLERVSGVTADDTLATQINKTRGGRETHGATVAYEFRDAFVVDGHLFTRQFFYRIADKKPAMLMSGSDIARFPDGVLASTPYGVKYFGHWLLDDLPLMIAARDLGNPVSVHTNPLPSQRDYMRLLELTIEPTLNASFDRFVVVDDIGQNEYKRERLLKLRKVSLAQAGVAPPPGVMLLRGSAGSPRQLVNEQEIAELVRARGFLVLDPRVTDTFEMLRTCAGTPIVLGVEGSQLTNGLMFIKPGGTLVTIQPPARFCMVLKDWCDCIGLQFAFIVGSARTNESFAIDGGALQRLLDRVS